MFANNFIKSLVQAITASIILLGYLFIVLFSFPIYIFRLIAIYLAKWVRSDLGPSLNAASACFVTDLFTGKSPRSTILLPITINGNLTRAELLENVQKKWIEGMDEEYGTLKFPQFQYFPCYWLGIPFWKLDPNFELENHVISYPKKTSITGEKVLTEQDLENFVESLLNAPYTTGKSPWDFHLIENYKNDYYPTSGPDPPTNLKTVIVLRIHHSMADGYSLLDALVGCLFECDKRDLHLPKIQYPKRTFWGELFYYSSIPLVGLKETSILLKDTFKSGPWKIPDSAKSWNQIYAKSKLIPIEDVKFIKNELGVGFTSVLFSVISASIQKHLKEKERNGLSREDCDSMLCLTAIPLAETHISRKIRIKNHITALAFKLPTCKFPTSVDRLKKCDEIIEACRRSVVPVVGTWYINSMGWLIGNLPYIFGRNRIVSTGLTNFPTKQNPNMCATIAGKEVLFSDCAVGGQPGNAGVGFTVISFYPFIRFAITAENAVLSRNEIRNLVTYIEDEIKVLLSIAKCNQYTI